MATTLYFRDNQGILNAHRGAAWYPYTTLLGVTRSPGRLPMSTSRGGSAVSTSVASVAGPTAGVESDSMWVSPPLAADITISQSITFNLRARETNMSANMAVNCRVLRWARNGTITEILKTARTTELGTSEAAANFSATPTSTAFQKGDRIMFSVFADDAGTMAANYAMNFYYNGPTAGASGDSYVTLTDDPTFDTTDPTGSTLYLTDVAASVGGAASLITTFDGTDENPLSEGGTFSILDSTYSALRRVSNYVRASVDAQDNGSYYNVSTFGADVEAYITISNAAGLAGIAARVQGAGFVSTWDGYMVAQFPTSNIYIYRVNNSVQTQLFAGTTPAAFANGDKIGIACHGSRIQAWWYDASATTWVLIGEVTDTTYANAGHVAVFSNSTSVEINDLYAGTVTGTFEAEREAWTSRDDGVVSDVVNTATGYTANPIFVSDTAGGSLATWYSRPLVAFTLAGPILLNLRGLESNSLANCSLGAEIAVVDSDGKNPVIFGRESWGYTDISSELLITETAVVCWVTGGDISVTNGQRLRIRVYIDDSAAMASGYTATFYYGGTSGGASGDSYITLGQSVSEYSLGPAASLVHPRKDRRIVPMLGPIVGWARRHDGLLVPG